MSASYFQTLIGFNGWAWGKVLEQAALLTPEQYTARQFNFGSVRSTLIHAAAAESSYLARLQGRATGARASEETAPEFGQLLSLWQAQFDLQAEYAATLTEAMVDETYSYIGGNGQEVTARRDIALAQMINHGTQHRSEVAMAITEAGHSPGDLDVFLYVRTLAAR